MAYYARQMVREYVYIPLGGNRKGKARTFFNLFVVWSLTALWHGANYNFLDLGRDSALLPVGRKALSAAPAG